MGPVVLGQTELRVQILLKHGLLRDDLKESGVDTLLVGLALVGDDGGLALVVEELLLGLGSVTLGLGEVTVVDGGGDLDGGDVDLGGGGDDVGLVDALQGNSVDLVGAGDEEEARVEDLEADGPLSAEAAGEEDDDGSRGDGGADLGGGAGSLPGGLGDGDVVSGVHAGRLSLGGDGLGGLLGSTGGNERAGHICRVYWGFVCVTLWVGGGGVGVRRVVWDVLGRVGSSRGAIICI